MSRFSSTIVDRMLFVEYERLAAGLPAFRILYALLLLLFVSPGAEWISGLPDSFLDPRPGPFLLLTSIPSADTVLAIELVRVAACAALLVGWRTPWASVAASLLTMTMYGLIYSFGKVDHTILLALTPLLLAPSGWGARWSVDAARGRTAAPRGWPVALLATAMGAAYAMAGASKLLGGWAAPSSQAAQRYVVRTARLKGEVLLGGVVEQVDSAVLWEVVDLATLGLEIGLLLLALRLAWFRAGLVGLVGLHVSVLLTMGIDFSSTVFAYAAFLPWDRVVQRTDRALGRLGALQRVRLRRLAPVAAAVPIAASTWMVTANRPLLLTAVRATVPSAESWIGTWPLVVAAVVAGIAVVRWARRAWVGLRGSWEAAPSR